MSFQQQNNLVGKKKKSMVQKVQIWLKKTPYDEKSKIFQLKISIANTLRSK